MEKRIIVAIDGPAGSGKSTLARRIATRLGFVYIDTGAMYRAVALWASRNGTPLDDHLKLEALAESAEIGLTADNEVWLNGEDVSVPIRTEEISQAASLVSKAAGVRRALVAKQRAMAQAAVCGHGRTRHRDRRVSRGAGQDFYRRGSERSE